MPSSPAGGRGATVGDGGAVGAGAAGAHAARISSAAVRPMSTAERRWLRMAIASRGGGAPSAPKEDHHDGDHDGGRDADGQADDGDG